LTCREQIHFFVCCRCKKLIFSEAICRPQLPYLYRQVGNTVCLLRSKCYTWRQLQKNISGTDTAQELILDEHFLEVKTFLLVWHRYWQWQRRRQYTDRLHIRDLLSPNWTYIPVIFRFTRGPSRLRQKKASMLLMTLHHWIFLCSFFLEVMQL
jgi:hypothetical protein